MHNYNKKKQNYKNLIKISKNKDFIELKKNGNKIISKSFILLYKTYQYKNFYLKFAPIASKKIGNAVIRNKAKRIIRYLALEISKKFNKIKLSIAILIIARTTLLTRKPTILIKEIKYWINKIYYNFIKKQQNINND